MKHALIFDMDGTVVDNMAYHTASWCEFFSRRGTTLDEREFFLRTAGRQGHEIMREFVRADLSDAECAQLNAERSRFTVNCMHRISRPWRASTR